MKHLVLTLMLVATALLLAASPSFAQTYVQQNIRRTGPESVNVEIRQEVNSGGTTSINTTTTELKNEARQAVDITRCAEVIARINARVGFYNERRNTHLQHYQNLQERISNLITKLKERGYDTSIVESALNELTRLVNIASNDYTDFIAKLEATKNYDCGTEEFRTAFAEAKTALETFQQDLKAIRAHIQSDLKTSLQDLKQQRGDS